MVPPWLHLAQPHPSCAFFPGGVWEQDYVRCVVVNPSSTDLLFSGSYDHTVRMWDLRTQSSVLQLDHGAPVESVVVFPSGGMCISAGGWSVTDFVRPIGQRL